MQNDSSQELEKLLDPAVMFGETELVWRYFFVDAQRHKLELFSRVAESLGYRVRSLLAPDLELEPTEPDEWTLQLESIHADRHARARYHELEGLANSYGLASFDGYTVSPLATATAREPSSTVR